MVLFETAKFLHVVGVAVWVGGVVTLGVLNARVARVDDAAVVTELGRLSGWLGQRLLGPAAGVTLLAGLVTAGAAGISMTTPWIVWGFAAIVVTVALGSTVIRRANERLAELLPSTGFEDPRVQRLRRRLARAGAVNLLILLSAIWAMVAKPS